MNKIPLYLFTSEYPFGNQETFLEGEIGVLCEDFEVTIVPRKVMSSLKRESPHNVKIDLGLSQLFNKRRYSKKFAFLNLFFWYTLLYHVRYLTSIQSIKRLSAFVAEYCQVKRFLGHKRLGSGDILYSYWFNGVALALTRSENATKVTRAHRYDVYEDLYNPMYMPFRKLAIKKLDKIYFISESGLNHVAQNYFATNKLALSRLGTSYYGQNLAEKYSPKGIIKIVSISNIYPVKRVDLIAQMLVQFCQKYQDIQMHWDHFGDGPELGKVDALLKSASDNLKGKVHKRIANREIHRALSHNGYDVLINLSSSEGLPVSMMEALSYGIPLLATNVGGVGEIVSDQTGLLLNEKVSSEDFSDALLRIKNNIDSGYFQRDSIHQIWQRKFNAESNFKEFSSELKQLHTDSRPKK